MLKLNSLIVLGILTCSTTANAQVITTLAKTGDSIPGGGSIASIDNLTINNSGEWAVNALTNTTGLNVLLLNGAEFLREGQPAPAPPGATVTEFDEFNLNNAGNLGQNLLLASPNQGVYFDFTLVARDGTVSAAPQLPAGTTYGGFPGVKLQNDQMFMFGFMSTPGFALIRGQLSGTGALVSESVIAKAGDTLPGMDQAIAGFGLGVHNWAANSSGSALYVIDGDGDTATDGAVYLDTTLIAREGSPSPVAGRNWLVNNNTRVDLNQNGDYVVAGQLSGTTSTSRIIVKNGAKFMQAGDTLPAVGGVFTFEGFGTQTPVQIDDGGNVLWWGDWNDPNANIDTGLFLNDTLLVQEGVTMIDGLLVDELAIQQNAFYMSDNGQYIIFEATLEGGVNGAFMIQVPEPGALSLVVMAAPALLRRRRRN